MSCTINLIKSLFSFLTSMFDVVSDVVNSMDFLGYNASHAVTSNTFLQHLRGKSTNNNISGENTIWGIVGMVIIFLPGIITLPPTLFIVWPKSWIWKLGVLIVLPLYPISLLLVQITGIFAACCGDKYFGKTHSFVMVAIGMEAFF